MCIRDRHNSFLLKKLSKLWLMPVREQSISVESRFVCERIKPPAEYCVVTRNVVLIVSAVSNLQTLSEDNIYCRELRNRTWFYQEFYSTCSDKEMSDNWKNIYSKILKINLKDNVKIKEGTSWTIYDFRSIVGSRIWKKLQFCPIIRIAKLSIK